MVRQAIALPEVDEVQITTITDNSLDILMAGHTFAQRFPLRRDAFDSVLPQIGPRYLVPGHLLAGGPPIRLLKQYPTPLFPKASGRPSPFEVSIGTLGVCT